MFKDDTLITTLDTLSKDHQPLIIGIDGRSASGKTSLARFLANEFKASIIHIDDFFLPAVEQTPEQLADPGGNIDFDRFISQVKKPLQKDSTLIYQVFSCKKQDFINEVTISAASIIVIEGAYSHHPKLAGLYDYTIFLTHDYQTQKNRILHRNGSDGLKMFEERWIPREEKYFKTYAIENKAAYIIDTRYLF
jgi:uridine kinase